MSRYHDLVLTRPQAWVALALTVGVEVFATMSVKASDGLTEPVPSACALVGFTLTTLLLAKVVQVVPTSVAYTVWTGSGSAAVAVLGVVLFGDHLTPVAWLGIALVVVGVVVLQRPDPDEAQPASATTQ